MGYNARKAAETIAYLIMKNDRRQIDVLKAVKLVYLADRESLKQYGYPIQYENRVSMPHGPVNSMTFNHINSPSLTDVLPSIADDWHTILTERKNHKVGLVNKYLSIDDLDEMSEADLEILDQIWEKFGDMSGITLCNWTHDPKNIPEWKDPNGSSEPISTLSILKAVGNPHPEKQVEYLEETEKIDNFFDRL